MGIGGSNLQNNSKTVGKNLEERNAVATEESLKQGITSAEVLTTISK